MRNVYEHGVKRTFDLILVALTTVVWGPLLAIVALAVRLRLGSPVLFRQTRPGLHGRPFQMIKFRTMTDGRDTSGVRLPDADRLTAFGRWLRSTSLDELPELLSVLIGDMSLVGPRPLLMEYLPRYTPHQARRHEVKPGITGWAQISGRNALTWEQKFELDVWYVEHEAMWLDIQILAKTVVRVFSRECINQPGHVTAEEFKGTTSGGLT